MSSILERTKDIEWFIVKTTERRLERLMRWKKRLKCNPEDGVIVISFDATRLGLEYTLAGKIALNVECNPLQGPYVDKVIKKLERSEYYDRISYVDETYFDYQTITREMIDSREY